MVDDRFEKMELLFSDCLGLSLLDNLLILLVVELLLLVVVVIDYSGLHCVIHQMGWGASIVYYYCMNLNALLLVFSSWTFI
jgi:hypothetical protein